MERQLGWGRLATLLGLALTGAGCGAASSGAPDRFPGEAWCVGASRLAPAPQSRREGDSLAKATVADPVKPVPERNERRVGDRVQVPFPSAVGGFDWWQSMIQFRATCRDADGAAKRVGDRGMECSLAPIDGLPVRVDLVSGTFCDGRLCGVTLVFYRGELAEKYDKIHGAIAAKYGAPQTYVARDDASACPANAVGDDRALYWFWESTALGLSAGCDDNGPTVELTYLTQKALKWGAEQNRRRQQSF